MKPDHAPPATAAVAATADGRPPRFAPKLLIVAAGVTLALLLLAGGAAAWLWPKSDAPAAKRAARKTVVAAATAASAAPPSAAASAAPAPSPIAAAVASAPSPTATAAGTAVIARQDAGAVAGAAADGAASVPAVSPLAAHDGDMPAPAMVALPQRAAEEPLDRLRRRIGQVLGPRAEVDAAHAGEWRVRTRADVVATAAHDNAARVAPAPITTAHATTALPTHWAYEGRGGPQAWGRLKPDFGLCANGQRQSPIDIRDGLALDLDPVQFDYRPGGFAVVDNGHTVQVDVAPGNFIDVMGRRYELQQFHFHRPSEERVDGRQFEMDVHLVHKDAEGRLAVVAVLLERGAAQPLLQTVWNHLPLERHEPFAARVPIDPQQLLPADRRYYTYMGSLTTPPCSEGVLWLVMRQPVPVSAQQIDIFARLYPMNARPIQRTAGRLIKQSN